MFWQIVAKRLFDRIIESWNEGEWSIHVIWNKQRIKYYDRNTDSITVYEIVKQGTIIGPKLCSVASEKINSIGEEISTHIPKELTIVAPVYVDDLLR